MSRNRRSQPSGLLIAGIVMGVVFIGLLMLIGMSMVANQVAEQNVPAQVIPPVQYDADDLANEYRQNAAATIAKLRGQKIELSSIHIRGMHQGFGAAWTLTCEYDRNDEKDFRGNPRKGTYRIRCSEQFAAQIDKNRVHTFAVEIDHDVLGEMSLSVIN